MKFVSKKFPLFGVSGNKMADEGEVYELTLDQLPYLCLLSVCEFLTAEDIGRFSRVSKSCYEVTRTESLWRRHSLWRWAFCDINQIQGDHSRWLRYFIARRKIEGKMDTGRPTRDYRVKSLRGHKSDIVSALCLNGTDINWENIAPPLLLTLSTDCVVHAWNITEGKPLWSIEDRPVQCITGNEGLVAIGDSEGLVILYNAPHWTQCGTVKCDGPVVAMTIAKIKSENVLFTSNIDNASGECNIKLWNMNTLHEGIPYMVLQCTSICNILNINGCGQWLAGTTNNDTVLVWDISDTTISTVTEPHITIHQSSVNSTHWLHPGILITTSGGPMPGPFLGPIPIPGLNPGPIPIPGPMLRRRYHGMGGGGQLQYWNVSKHLKDSKQATSSVYQVSHMYDSTKTLNIPAIGNNVILRICNNCILLGDNIGTLHVLDIVTGNMLQSFTDHKGPITDIYTDSYRVLTCSNDFSIRVYRWKRDKERGVQLVSLYQLLGGSVAHKTHDGFHTVLCSAGSCVGVAGNIIKLYNFNTTLTDNN